MFCKKDIALTLRGILTTDFRPYDRGQPFMVKGMGSDQVTHGLERAGSSDQDLRVK